MSKQQPRQRPSIVTGLMAAALIASGAPILAQDVKNYPEKPIQIIVGYAAGGNADLRARQLGQEMTKILGKPIIVENKAGAGGNIGTDYVAKAKPDGYTLGMGNFAPLAVNHALFKSLPYDPINDLVPIIAIERGPLILMVPIKSPYKTVAELVKASKADPKGLSAANGGIGGSHHLSAELLKQSTGANLVTVSYKGGGPAATDLMAGNVDLLFEQMYAAMPSIQSGKARALAITSKSRLALVPDVPTVAESAGVPGYEVLNWQGLIAPKGTPRAIIDKLNAAANQALKTPELRQKITSQGNEPLGGTPEEFAALIKSESQKWGEVVRKADIKPE